jgi:hypothetical protein
LKTTFVSSALIVLTVATTGCLVYARARFERTAPDPYPAVPREARQVTVLLSNARPTRPVVDVGTIIGESGAHALNSGPEGRAEVFMELQEAAGRQGCDAISLSEPLDKLFATSNNTPLYKAHQTAQCLMYLPSGAGSPGTR